MSQLQVKLPMVSAQLCSQPPFVTLHSSMSAEQQDIDLIAQHLCTAKHYEMSKLLPMQFNPFSSSWYPVSQLQMKLPMVLVQLWSQPPFAVLHSLMSMKQQGILFKGTFMQNVVSSQKNLGLKSLINELINSSNSVQVQLFMKECRSE